MAIFQYHFLMAIFQLKSVKLSIGLAYSKFVSFALFRSQNNAVGIRLYELMKKLAQADWDLLHLYLISNVLLWVRAVVRTLFFLCIARNRRNT